MTKAQQMLEFIQNSITKGATIHICTYGHIIKVTPKTFDKFKAAGHELFLIDKVGALRIASGRNYNVICTPTTSLVTVKSIL